MDDLLIRSEQSSTRDNLPFGQKRKRIVPSHAGVRNHSGLALLRHRPQHVGSGILVGAVREDEEMHHRLHIVWIRSSNVC